MAVVKGPTHVFLAPIPTLTDTSLLTTGTG